MKKSIVFILILFASTFSFAQSRFTAKDSTSKLPAGLYMSKGKVMLKKGYSTKLSKNGNVVMVMAPGGGNNISGAFSCNCKEANGGSCIVATTGSVIACSGTCMCVMSITIDGFHNNLPINFEEEPSPEKGWKVLVINSKTK